MNTSMLDERLPGLFLDSLAPVEAAIGSAAAGVPYAAMRSAMNVDEDGRIKLLRSAKAAVAGHREFFAEHRAAFEFLIPLMAIIAAKVDGLLTLAGAEHENAGLEPAPFSTRDALVIGLIVLGPALLLAGFAFYKLLKEG